MENKKQYINQYEIYSEIIKKFKVNVIIQILWELEKMDLIEKDIIY